MINILSSILTNLIFSKFRKRQSLNTMSLTPWWAHCSELSFSHTATLGGKYCCSHLQMRKPRFGRMVLPALLTSDRTRFKALFNVPPDFPLGKIFTKKVSFRVTFQGIREERQGRKGNGQGFTVSNTYIYYRHTENMKQM